MSPAVALVASSLIVGTCAASTRAGAPAASMLAPPVLDRLPAGAIQPRGWLLDQANLQGNGMTGALGYFGGGISTSLWIDNNVNGTARPAALPSAAVCTSTGADPTEAASASECPIGCVFVYGMRGEDNTCVRDDVEDGLGAQEEQGGGYYLNGMSHRQILSGLHSFCVHLMV